MVQMRLSLAIALSFLLASFAHGQRSQGLGESIGPKYRIADAEQPGFGLPDSQFGSSLAFCGDVNGDGRDDILIGDKSFGTLESMGKAYLHLGSNDIGQDPEWTAMGQNAKEYLGCSVAGAGDIDADGYDDVIIGAFGHPGGGAAFVYRGSPTGLSLAPDFTLQLNGSFWFGLTVAGLGDVNADGYDDVLVGDPGYLYDDDVRTGFGRIAIYFGRPSGLNTTPWLRVGSAQSHGLGRLACGLDDLNNDGFDDFAVAGSRFFTTVDIHYGSAGGPYSAPGQTLSFPHDGIDDLAFAGDVNGDGHPDLLIGAEYHLFTEHHVFLGNGIGLESAASWERLSCWASRGSTAGDFNGDGFDDLVLGDMLCGGLVFFGSGAGLSPPGSPDLRFRSPRARYNPYFDYSWAYYRGSGGGDFNGDGIDDIAFGDAYSPGQEHVYFVAGPNGGLLPEAR